MQTHTHTHTHTHIPAALPLPAQPAASSPLPPAALPPLPRCQCVPQWLVVSLGQQGPPRTHAGADAATPAACCTYKGSKCATQRQRQRQNQSEADTNTGTRTRTVTGIGLGIDTQRHDALGGTGCVQWTPPLPACPCPGTLSSAVSSAPPAAAALPRGRPPVFHARSLRPPQRPSVPPCPPQRSAPAA